MRVSYRPTELMREQLERIERVVERQLAYYLEAWRRAQANDMPLDDPLVRGICEEWEAINLIHPNACSRICLRLRQRHIAEGRSIEQGRLLGSHGHADVDRAAHAYALRPQQRPG